MNKAEYTQAKSIVDNLAINATQYIKPVSVKLFRKYLSEISTKGQKQFITRLDNDRVRVVRIR